jgi:hypothetical protein
MAKARNAVPHLLTMAHGAHWAHALSEQLRSFPDTGGLSRLVEGFVMQSEKVMRLEGKGGISPATVIAEFHFENFWTEDLHNGAHLSADQTGFGHVAHQSDNGEEFEISHAPSFL